MRKFAELFTRLDQTNRTTEKTSIISEYFASADENDKLRVLYLFSGRKLKKYFNTTQLWNWTVEYSGLPAWLADESYHSVGDMAETISLILPAAAKKSNRTLTYWINYLESLKDLSEEEKKKKLIGALKQLTTEERFVFFKLITGGFRIGVSQKIVINALSSLTSIEPNIIAHRLMGNWSPENIDYQKLIYGDDSYEDISRPYPFFLAYPVEGEPSGLGTPAEWQAEWKWDGIRGQVIKRKGELFVWSRGEELVTDKFPEFAELTEILPEGTVLDGEIICFTEGKPLPFNVLQTRIGRKNLTPKILNEAPVSFIVYDIMEFEGQDIRDLSLTERRKKLDKLLVDSSVSNILVPSPVIEYNSWDALKKIREGSRENVSEGIMLKRKDSPYGVGRKKGDWWKWKIDPFTVDAVMIYAQKGHGRRADLFTDYTFALWDGDKLVTFAKAYSGLTNEEIKEVDAFVKSHTLEKFGPVRTVKPELVFEIAFEGISESKRHKSGVAVRFPRIARWRKDKKPAEADTLENIKKLLNENKA
ncbi:MAG: ATP-dependent DNA ligase [Ignavibacteria bacterium]|nr:ATP-dependent DNA ligase [Ignavibacteria bacterium]